MKGTILLVGAYPALLGTRAELLHEWDTTTSSVEGALDAIRARPYDLLVVCQSVPYSSAETLIAHARQLRSGLKVLALSYDGEERRFGTVWFSPFVYKPALFKDAVTRLMNSPFSPPS